MQSRAMRRAVRSARAVLRGDRILEFIQHPKTRRLLVDAAASGAPPVTAISSKLLELVGPKDARLAPVKQFVGVCIRAVLEEEGFDLAESGVRVSNDPIFRTGSTYQPVQAGKSVALLVRIIEALTDEEARQALRLLRNRKR
jgi:hypothetical protein